MFSKHISVKNFNHTLPRNYSDPVRLPLLLLANHIFKELSSVADYFSIWLEFLLLTRRLEISKDLTLKKESLPRFREGKRNISNLFGRAFGRTLLDKNENVCVFDEMERYFPNSKLNRLFPSSITATLKVKKDKSPDFLAQDTSGNYHILESKGRMSGYSQKTLNSFVRQSQNVRLTSNGKLTAHKTWAIPLYLSTNIGSSYTSIVDPKFEGEEFFTEPDYTPLKHSYSNIFNLIGHHHIASLLEKPESILRTESEIKTSIVTVNMANAEKQFIVAPLFPFRYKSGRAMEDFFIFRRFFDFPGENILLFGLEFNVFKAILQALRTGENDFRSIFNTLKELGKNDDESVGYSSDGTAVFSINNVVNFREASI